MPAFNTYESILYAHQQAKDWSDSADHWYLRFNQEVAAGGGGGLRAESLTRSLGLAREQATFWRNLVELRLAARAKKGGE